MATFLGASMGVLAADNISSVFGSYGGLWASTSGGPADGRNDLLAFTVPGGTYSTGVNDAALTPGTFVAAKFRAFKPDPNEIPLTGGLNAIPQSGSYNPGKSRAAYLSDGVNGLDLNTALFNIPKTELQFFASVTNANAITDGVPDVLVTQVGQPSATTFDEFYFTDGAGNIVGNPVQIIFGGSSAVPSIGKQNWQFWNPNHTAQPGLNGDRELRMRAYHLSDFGITAANMGQITKFVQKLSGESDLSFVAYNDEAVQVPALLTVEKDNGLTQLHAGKIGVVYKVTVSNVGGETASNVSWKDEPQGVTVRGITSVTPPVPGSGDSSGLCSLTGCTDITLSPGNSFTYEVTADVTGAAGATAINTAKVDGGGCEEGVAAQPGAECTSTDEDPIVTPTASITVTKDNHVTEVVKGSTILYAVIITNNGDDEVTGLSWKESADGLEILNIAPMVRAAGVVAGVCSSTGCTGIDLPPGGSIRYAVLAKVTADAGGLASNSVVVNGGECDNGTSTNPNAICTAEDKDPVVAPSLKITKTSDFTSAKAGDPISYTVRIENTGTGAAVGLRWQDVPQNMTIQSIDVVSVSSGSVAGPCSLTGCEDITLEKNGGVVVYRVNAKVNDGATGNVVNTANLTGDGCTPADCTSTDTDPIQPPPVEPTAPTPVPVDSRIMLILLALMLMAGAWRAGKMR